jgi:hypothetical protein
VLTVRYFSLSVQLIFDEEFIGGKGLQGSCSQFRGRLAPWTDLLLVSRTTEYQDFKKAGGKAGATGAGVAPHQVKKVLQKGHEGASATTHATTAGAKPSYAKAAHAAPTAPVMAPAVLTQAHANAGAKLLKALQKEDHQKSSTTKAAPHGTGAHATHAAPHAPTTTAMLSPASKVTILKKKIGVVDKPTTAASAAPASNGTGKNILAEAAGFSAADLGSDASLLPAYETLQQHALMAGVISYQAQQATALHKSSLTAAPVLPPPPHVGHHAAGAHGVHPPHPPTAQHGGAHQPQQKLVLNKDATRRIVTHELKPNASVDAAHKPTAGAEKKPPAAAAKKTAHAAHDTSATAAEDAGTTAPAQDATAAPADSTPPATTGAALLAKLKKHAPKNTATAAGSEGHKTPAVETAPHKADAHAHAASHAEKAHPTAAPHAPSATGAHTTTAKPLTMAEKLANAKRVMKEKQEQQMAHSKVHGDGAHGHHEAGAADSHAHVHGHTAHAAEAGAAAHASHAQGATAATHAAPSHATGAAHKDKAAHQAPTQKTDKPKGANIVSILTKAKAESAAKADNAPTTAVTEPASGAQEEAKAPAATTATTGAGKNIKQLLLNAKRTTAAPSTDTVAPTAVDATAPPSAPQEGEAAKSHTQGTAAPKKKVAASLVPSKVLISKAK